MLDANPSTVSSEIEAVTPTTDGAAPPPENDLANRPPVWAWMWALVAGTILTGAGLVVSIMAGSFLWADNVSGAINLAVGLFVWSRRPEDALGRVLTAIGLLGPVSLLGAAAGGFVDVETRLQPSAWAGRVVQRRLAPSDATIWTALRSR